MPCKSCIGSELFLTVAISVELLTNQKLLKNTKSSREIAPFLRVFRAGSRLTVCRALPFVYLRKNRSCRFGIKKGDSERMVSGSEGRPGRELATADDNSKLFRTKICKIIQRSFPPTSRVAAVDLQGYRRKLCDCLGLQRVQNVSQDFFWTIPQLLVLLRHNYHEPPTRRWTSSKPPRRASASELGSRPESTAGSLFHFSALKTLQHSEGEVRG